MIKSTYNSILLQITLTAVWGVLILHGGHPKFWRIIASCFGIKYLALPQKLAQEYFPDCSNCKWFPLQKQLVVNDSELSKNRIPFVHVSSKFSF
jgi:hypothetical protein